MTFLIVLLALIIVLFGVYQVELLRMMNVSAPPPSKNNNSTSIARMVLRTLKRRKP